jgi:S1-C subfamily serine protease
MVKRAWHVVISATLFLICGFCLPAAAEEVCCFTNPTFSGVCVVSAGPDETCNSILAYLNNQMSHGRTYCGFTNIRGGWRQASCPEGQLTPVTMAQPAGAGLPAGDTVDAAPLVPGPVTTEILADVFQRVNPAVVDIATVQSEVADSGPIQRAKTGGLGSGFLISEDGSIMTAAHVVQTAEEIMVRFIKGEPVAARDGHC